MYGILKTGARLEPVENNTVGITFVEAFTMRWLFQWTTDATALSEWIPIPALGGSNQCVEDNRAHEAYQ
jgi:hypothetical protein